MIERIGVELGAPAGERAAARTSAPAAERPLHGAASTRRIEQRNTASLPPFTLMARAGLAVARLALAVAPHARRIDVMAGPGNNGGDGLEAASLLRGWGKSVRVLLAGDEAALPADASRALERARAAGVDVVAAGAVDELRNESRDAAGRSADAPELAIDALLGIGASRPPGGELAALSRRLGGLRAGGAVVLAIDVPSGLDCSTGRALGADAVVADHTLSLLTLKPGLFTADGRDHAGTAWLDTLDCESDRDAPDAWLSGLDGGAAMATRRHAQHKGSFGDVVVVGGATGMTGAALLAARAAQAAGAGRVYVDLLDERAAAAGHDLLRPELMWRSGWWREASPATLAATTAVCGCGGGDAVRAALPRLLSCVARLVLDADALNAIAADAALQRQLRARAGRSFASVLTPHPLEAARLLGRTTADVQADRLAAAQDLADRFACIVVLKGSGSVIAGAGLLPRINATGNASLASAGTGDVLAGWLGGCWSQQPAEHSEQVAALAAHAVASHGAAAEPLKPGAWRAGDLVERLLVRARGS